MESLITERWLDAQIHNSAALWHVSAGPWFNPSPTFPRQEQRDREHAYDRALREVKRLARIPDRSTKRFRGPSLRLFSVARAGDATAGSTCNGTVPAPASPRNKPAEIEAHLIAAFARFAAHALDLGPDAIDLLTQGFLPVGTELARWAHRFDPTLPNAGIVQACRNAWTACGLQPMLGAPMALTPAILAYSLLYPYTDNFLDQRSVSSEDKLHFNQRFRLRLQGDPLAPAGHHESCSWHMVALIEQQFPRTHHPDVYASLLAIHAAQTESVLQLAPASPLDESTLLRITCAKGGTSVLADAAIVHGVLTPADAEFAFLWGVLLQLGDDLQDVHEDLARGSDTLFTRELRAGRPLDALVSQLLNLSDLTAARMDALPHGRAIHKDLLRMSWRSLIQMAVAQAHQFFTAPFLAALESRSPFRFAFLRSRRKKLDGNSGLFHRLFESLLTDSADVRQDFHAPSQDYRAPSMRAVSSRAWVG